MLTASSLSQFIVFFCDSRVISKRVILIIEILGQERDPPGPLKPTLVKQEPEDILDIDDYSSTERRKSCKLTVAHIFRKFIDARYTDR